MIKHRFGQLARTKRCETGAYVRRVRVSLRRVAELTTLWYTRRMSTVSYLDRFLQPVTEAFTPELARVLVDLRADDELQAEVEVLREKANIGTLSPDEEVAYKDFVEAVDVISIIQSKAHRFLASQLE